MARTKRSVKPLPTIWEASDEQWTIIQPILDKHDPPADTGRPRTDERAAFNGVIYHLRTGCQWEALPDRFGSKSAVHRAFQRWVDKGILRRIWAELVDACEELGEVDWQWQSADGAMGKARFGGTMSVPTPRIAVRMARSAA